MPDSNGDGVIHAVSTNRITPGSPGVYVRVVPGFRHSDRFPPWCPFLVAAWCSRGKRLEHSCLDTSGIHRCQGRPLLYRGMDSLSQSSIAEPQRVAGDHVGDGVSHRSVCAAIDGTSSGPHQLLRSIASIHCEPLSGPSVEPTVMVDSTVEYVLWV